MSVSQSVSQSVPMPESVTPLTSLPGISNILLHPSRAFPSRPARFRRSRITPLPRFDATVIYNSGMPADLCIPAYDDTLQKQPIHKQIKDIQQSKDYGNIDVCALSPISIALDLKGAVNPDIFRQPTLG